MSYSLYRRIILKSTHPGTVASNSPLVPTSVVSCESASRLTQRQRRYSIALIFVIGNGTWGSRSEANLHALKTFTSRVPKHCIAMITRIDIMMYFLVRHSWGPNHHLVDFIMRPSASKELQSVTRTLLKYFTGVEWELLLFLSQYSNLKIYRSIDIFACSLDAYLYLLHSQDASTRLRGYKHDAVKAVRILRDHPRLKKIQFRDEKFVESGSFVDMLNHCKEERQHTIACIPFQKAQWIISGLWFSIELILLLTSRSKPDIFQLNVPSQMTNGAETTARSRRLTAASEAI